MGSGERRKGAGVGGGCARCAGLAALFTDFGLTFNLCGLRNQREPRAETMVSEERAFLDEAQAWCRNGGDIDALVPPQSDTITPLTRLCLAVFRGYCSALRWLLDHGARMEACSLPLHIAAHNDRCDAAVLLLDAGAHVDERNRSPRGGNHTALHRAAAGSPYAVKMCKLLLSRGASLDARNDDGQDPEAFARYHGQDHEARVRAGRQLNNAAFLADVRAAGGWSAYVAAPRNQLLALRHELPARRRTGPCRARAQARLFLDAKIPDDVFMHVLTFWRSARDSAY